MRRSNRSPAQHSLKYAKPQQSRKHPALMTLVWMSLSAKACDGFSGNHPERLPSSSTESKVLHYARPELSTSQSTEDVSSGHRSEGCLFSFRVDEHYLRPLRIICGAAPRRYHILPWMRCCFPGHGKYIPVHSPCGLAGILVPLQIGFVQSNHTDYFPVPCCNFVLGGSFYILLSVASRLIVTRNTAVWNPAS